LDVVLTFVFVSLVILGSLVLVVVLFNALIIKMTDSASRSREALLQLGEHAVAKVLHVRDLGARFNDQPKLAITLDVSGPNGKSYQLVITEYVSILHIHRVQEGLTVDVLIDPNDPNRIILAL
jgi:hypothetical protein